MFDDRPLNITGLQKLQRAAGRLRNHKGVRLFAPAILTGVILGYLFFRLSEIGWSAVIAEAPQSALFYLLFLPLYFLAPLSDLVIYRRLWRVGWRSFPVFVQKRVYNDAVLDYSGEIFLYTWAVANPALKDHRHLADIRDVNLLSGLGVNLMMIAVAGSLILSHWTGVLGPAKAAVSTALALAIVIVLLGGTAAILFRGRLFGLSMRNAVAIGGQHLARLVLTQLLTLLQWHVAIPSVSLPQWLLFLSVNFLVSNLPFGFGRYAMQAGAGIALGSMLAVPQSAIAALFSITAASFMIFHFAIMALFRVRKPPQPTA